MVLDSSNPCPAGSNAYTKPFSQGYPFRIFHKKFYQRYKMISLVKEEEDAMATLDGQLHREIVEAFFTRLTAINKDLEGGW